MFLFLGGDSLACFLFSLPFTDTLCPLSSSRSFRSTFLVPPFELWYSYLSSLFVAYSFVTQGILITSVPYHNMPADRPVKKNSSRSNCKGFACGGGKLGFKHVCSKCKQWFCPKCVVFSERHKCLVIEPEPEPYSHPLPESSTSAVRWDSVLSVTPLQ